jgi:N-acetylglucosamine kinase-like BadF-type ATPase
LHAVGRDAALAALNAAVDRAFLAAGLSRQPVSATCLGLAGAARPEEQATIRAWANEVRLAEKTEVTSDVSLLLEAGTPEGWGLALVAGTGSCAWGRTSQGQIARAGGWGYLLGDEGSGYALALAGLQAVARAADGRGPATVLTSFFLEELGVREPPQLVTEVYQGNWDRARLASLAPLVMTAAFEHDYGANSDQPDAVAVRIVEQAARSLAEAAAAVARQLNWQGKLIPVALAGGLLTDRGYTWDGKYRELVLEYMRQLGIIAHPVGVVPEPAIGALRRAANLVSH